MPYIELANFKFGLETRRSELTAQPGTLVTCENAHINQGGEIEKRKKFAVFADLSALNTFGLEVTSAGLVTFGSEDLASSMPVGVTYIRLQHPAVTDGATEDPGSHAMDLLLCSTSYGGISFAVARFTDGNAFAFYGTTCVGQWRDGVVLTGTTGVSDIAAQAAAALERELSNYEATATGAAVDLKAAAGGTFASEKDENSVLGSITKTDVSAGSEGTAGVGASVVITFTDASAPSSSGEITQMTAPGSVALLAAAVPYSGSLTNWASLVATAINATGTGYTAEATGVDLTIHAPVSLGDSVNGQPIVIEYTGTVAFNATGVLSLAASVTPERLSGYVSSLTPVTQVVRTSGTAQATGSGGVVTSGYTYLWENSSGASGIVEAISPTSANTGFRSNRALEWEETVMDYMRCKITDNKTPTANEKYTPYIAVTLAILNKN